MKSEGERKTYEETECGQLRVLLHLWAGSVLLTTCQTACSICSKANMKEGKSVYVCLYNCTQGKTKKDDCSIGMITRMYTMNT